jgi:hypothetical protein
VLHSSACYQELRDIEGIDLIQQLFRGMKPLVSLQWQLPHARYFLFMKDRCTQFVSFYIVPNNLSGR